MQHLWRFEVVLTVCEALNKRPPLIHCPLQILVQCPKISALWYSNWSVWELWLCLDHFAIRSLLANSTWVQFEVWQRPQCRGKSPEYRVSWWYFHFHYYLWPWRWRWKPDENWCLSRYTPVHTDVYLRVLACVSRLSGLCSLKMGMSGLTKMPNKTERIHLISQSLNSKILCNTRKKRNFTKSRI